jgi:hypothetical protein
LPRRELAVRAFSASDPVLRDAGSATI